jgi:hypothetical protein
MPNTGTRLFVSLIKNHAATKDQKVPEQKLGEDEQKTGSSLRGPEEAIKDKTSSIASKHGSETGS